MLQLMSYVQQAEKRSYCLADLLFNDLHESYQLQPSQTLMRSVLVSTLIVMRLCDCSFYSKQGFCTPSIQIVSAST